jgi:phospholipase/carboxylesterase
VALAVLLLVGGCARPPAAEAPRGAAAPVASDLSAEARQGRLRSRPAPPTEEAPAPGLRKLGLGGARDGLLYVPSGYRADRPAPLVVMLHGAGGNAEGALAPLRALADEAGLLLLAPESRGRTWDLLLEGLGPDVAFLDRALGQVFARYAVDPARIALEGFSDGASYALALGLANGDLFGHVIAFSPGFLAPPGQHGEPRLFVSHGTHDTVLAIDLCSRLLVPRVREAGYRVHYREFVGGHSVPPTIAREALDWFIAEPPAATLPPP